MIEPGLEPLINQCCPDCARSQFLRGPGGGAAVNIECAACGARYSVATWAGGLLAAERIAYNGVWPDRGEWRLE